MQMLVESIKLSLRPDWSNFSNNMMDWGFGQDWSNVHWDVLEVGAVFQAFS